MLLIDALARAAAARVAGALPRRASRGERLGRGGVPGPAAPPTTTDTVVAIGASTGGTEALRRPARGDAPGRPGHRHRAAHARGLHRGLRATASTDPAGSRSRRPRRRPGPRGRALIAPGNRHTALRRTGRTTSSRSATARRLAAPAERRRPLPLGGARRAERRRRHHDRDGRRRRRGPRRDEARGRRDARPGRGDLRRLRHAQEAIARGAVDEVLPLPRIPAAILRAAKAERAAR